MWIWAFFGGLWGGGSGGPVEEEGEDYGGEKRFDGEGEETVDAAGGEHCGEVGCAIAKSEERARSEW